MKQRGKAILLTSHILETLLNSCDSISYLHEGRIQRNFYPEEYALIEQELFEEKNKEQKDIVQQLVNSIRNRS